MEGSKVLQDDTNVSETFKDFFSNAVTNLNIEINSEFLHENVTETEPVKNAIKRYENHPSIIKIKDMCRDEDNFCFKHASICDIQTEIMLLNNSKACPKDTIPPNIIKNNCDILASKLLFDF